MILFDQYVDFMFCSLISNLELLYDKILSKIDYDEKVQIQVMNSNLMRRQNY
jgi:hypothetical protein